MPLQQRCELAWYDLRGVVQLTTTRRSVFKTSQAIVAKSSVWKAAVISLCSSYCVSNPWLLYSVTKLAKLHIEDITRLSSTG